MDGPVLSGRASSPALRVRVPSNSRTRSRRTGGYKSDGVEPSAVQLECVFFGPFRDAVGEKTVRHETDAGTVGDLLVDLEATYPDLEGELVAEDGDGLAGDTVVTRNERNVRHEDGLETTLEAGDVIRLVPSVYGG